MPKQQYATPILAPAIEEQIADAIEQFTHKQKWKDWGMDKVREQGAAILLYGPPGTGKSITAMYIAKRLHLSMLDVNIAEYGSHIPGELARNIHNLFGNAIVQSQIHGKTLPMVFMDECDACLPSRTKLDAHSLWMLEPITALLKEVGVYPGLVVLATNLDAILDAALERRLLARIYIGRPEKEQRKQIWLAKIPEKFPVKMTEDIALELSRYDLSGAEIENEFLLWAGRLIRQDITEPNFFNLIKQVNQKHTLVKDL